MSKQLKKNEGDGNIIIIKKETQRKKQKKMTVLVLKDNNDIRSAIFGSQKTRIKTSFKLRGKMVNFGSYKLVCVT